MLTPLSNSFFLGSLNDDGDNTKMRVFLEIKRTQWLDYIKSNYMSKERSKKILLLLSKM